MPCLDLTAFFFAFFFLPYECLQAKLKKKGIKKLGRQAGTKTFSFKFLM